MSDAPPGPPAIFLMGPTASGKSELAAHLVERLPVEIVSVDSALVYRGLDIGTAKPDAALLARAPHRLIDIVEPEDPYSAGRFRADAVAAIDEIRAAGLYDEIWQAFVAVLPVRTVGVMGDGRTYDYACALRAVTSVDGMTADYYPFSHEFLGETATRIINEVRGINRVTYDITSKPPGTIEWE